MSINFFSNKSNLNTVHYIVSSLLINDNSVDQIIRVNKNINKNHLKKLKKKSSYRSWKLDHNIKLVS